MVIYMDLVVILNFLVDFLLLLGTNRLSGYPLSPGRAAIASALGGIYAGVCLLPRFSFLGNTFWRSVSLLLMGLIAFGMQRSACRRCVLFFLLSMALGGIALGLEGGFLTLLFSALGVAALCIFGFRGKLGKQFLPVEIPRGERAVCLTALVDTGNCLRDPVTGRQVLIIGADAAVKLTGLSRQQLQNPVENVGAIPGLRLIPYSAVGKTGGFLLGMGLENVKVGEHRGYQIVAFAPQNLGKEYGALTGGRL